MCHAGAIHLNPLYRTQLVGGQWQNKASSKIVEDSSVFVGNYLLFTVKVRRRNLAHSFSSTALLIYFSVVYL